MAGTITMYAVSFFQYIPPFLRVFIVNNFESIHLLCMAYYALNILSFCPSFKLIWWIYTDGDLWGTHTKYIQLLFKEKFLKICSLYIWFFYHDGPLNVRSEPGFDIDHSYVQESLLRL